MKLFAYITLTILSYSSFAQTTLLSEDFSSGIPSTWTLVNADGNTPNSAVSQFTSAWIHYVTPFDTCVASTSYYTDSLGQSADYLITPALNLLTYGNFISWDAKSFDGSYPDSYVVLISDTDTNPNSFTDTLKMVQNESPYWTHYSYDLSAKGYSNQTVYIAFKNITTNGFILGIDNVVATADDPAYVNEQNSIELLIYPNPVVDVLTIVTDDFLKAELYSVNGQLILSSNLKTINVSDVVQGVYFIKVTTQKGSVVKKIVIK